MELRYEYRSEIHPVRVEADGSAWKVTIGARTYLVRAELFGARTLLLHIDGRPVHAHWARRGADRFVATNGHPYTLARIERTAKVRASGAHSDANAAIVAPMPGKVLRVHVEVGQPVTAGQELVTLEAMKMEYALKAPQAGTVTALHVAVGQQVALGVTLAEITP